MCAAANPIARGLLACLLCSGLASSMSFGQAGAAEDDSQVTSDMQRSVAQLPPTLQKWSDRLLVLSSRDPEGYLLLGEEVLDEAADSDTRRFAVELLVRAFDLARASDASSPIATSACLALVDAAITQGERQRLRSLAGALVPNANDHRNTTIHVESPEYLASVAMGLARAGHGFQARSMMRKPEALQTMRSIDGLLTRMGVPGGADAYEREAKRWPCMECGNRGVTRRRDGVARECGNCNGTPGPDWSQSQTLASLRGELWLLRDDQQAWSLQSMLDDGRPAELVDPGLVARMFRVDSSKAYWRGNAWRTNADGTDALPATDGSPALPAMQIDPTKREQPTDDSATPAPQTPVTTPAPTPVPGTPGGPASPVPLPGPMPGLNPLPIQLPPALPGIPRNPNSNPSEDPLPTEPK